MEDSARLDRSWILTNPTGNKMALRLEIDPDAWTDAANVNPGFRRATTDVLTRVIDKFASKAVDYEDAADELGIKAQFVDINRKVKKLKRWMWDGKPLHGEQADEIMMDLIAHLLLTLEMLNHPQPVIAE